MTYEEYVASRNGDVSWPVDGLHMTCDNCRWKVERNECMWDFDYEGTDYAEDCCDFRNVDNPQDSFTETA